MRGRTVMIYNRPEGDLVQVFQVGVEDMHGVIKALLEEHPDLNALHIVVDGVIDQTSVAFLELGPGEVRAPRSPHHPRRGVRCLQPVIDRRHARGLQSSG